jgi:hypothetical protein
VEVCQDAEAFGVDTVNHQEVRIIEVGLVDAVPGKNHRLLSTVKDLSGDTLSRHAGVFHPTGRLNCLPLRPLDLYGFMSDADVENVVFVHLHFPGTGSAITARGTDAH